MDFIHSWYEGILILYPRKSDRKNTKQETTAASVALTDVMKLGEPFWYFYEVIAII